MLEQIDFVLFKLWNGIGSVLTIGLRPDSDQSIFRFCYSHDINFSVLEVWKPNCDFFSRLDIFDKIYCEDCRNIDKISESFDAILWLHGPEHIPWEEFLTTRTKIEDKANKLVIYQMPFGSFPQDALYGNPYERHVQTLMPDMFSKLGYSVIIDGDSCFTAFIEKV